MKPNKKLIRKLAELCSDEIEEREQEGDDDKMNLVLAGWNGHHIEIYMRDGTPSLERAIRKAIREEGQ
jgi:hypothetical protein